MAAFEDINADRTKFNVELRDEAEFQRRTDVFEQWLLSNGAEFPQLEIKCYDDEVRGVHAKENIPGDTICIKIPLKCLITVEMGKVSISRALWFSAKPWRSPGVPMPKPNAVFRLRAPHAPAET